METIRKLLSKTSAVIFILCLILLVSGIAYSLWFYSTQQVPQAKKLVYISGEVNNPGVYQVYDDVRVVDLINLAGGYSDNADSNYINQSLNLAEKVKDEQKIFIPPSTTTAAVDSVQLVNINTASEADINSLPGISDAIAKKIVQGRPYTQKEDLLKVQGIGDSHFNQIKDLITL